MRGCTAWCSDTGSERAGGPMCSGLLGRRPLLAAPVAFLLLLVALSPLGLLAQEGEGEAEQESEVSPQIWVDYNPAKRLTERWELYGDAGLRTELQSGGWFRIVVRPSVRYSLSNIWRLAGGLGGLYTVNTDSLVANRFELRPWQGVRLNWPNWKLPFDHFLRLEERFEWNTRSGELDASLRLRYRLRVSYRWDSFIREDRHWQAHASAELFGRLAGQDGQFKEQARLGLGIERSFSRRARIRVEIIWQKVDELFAGPVNDIYLRVRVFHNWD